MHPPVASVESGNRGDEAEAELCAILAAKGDTVTYCFALLLLASCSVGPAGMQKHMTHMMISPHPTALLLHARPLASAWLGYCLPSSRPVAASCLQQRLQVLHRTPPHRTAPHRAATAPCLASRLNCNSIRARPAIATCIPPLLSCCAALHLFSCSIWLSELPFLSFSFVQTLLFPWPSCSALAILLPLLLAALQSHFFRQSRVMPCPPLFWLALCL